MVCLWTKKIWWKKNFFDISPLIFFLVSLSYSFWVGSTHMLCVWKKLKKKMEKNWKFWKFWFYYFLSVFYFFLSIFVFNFFLSYSVDYFPLLFFFYFYFLTFFFFFSFLSFDFLASLSYSNWLRNIREDPHAIFLNKVKTWKIFSVFENLYNFFPLIVLVQGVHMLCVWKKMKKEIEKSFWKKFW